MNRLKRSSAESQQLVESCIRRALELGVNHIETARGYGSSEVQLGQILPTLPRELTHRANEDRPRRRRRISSRPSTSACPGCGSITSICSPFTASITATFSTRL